MVERLLEELLQSKWGRLKWKVLREFGTLPGSPEARKMSDNDYLVCALYILADTRSQRGGWNEKNPEFDMKRFEELRGAGKHYRAKEEGDFA